MSHPQQGLGRPVARSAATGNTPPFTAVASTPTATASPTATAAAESSRMLRRSALPAGATPADPSALGSSSASAPSWPAPAGIQRSVETRSAAASQLSRPSFGLQPPGWTSPPSTHSVPQMEASSGPGVARSVQRATARAADAVAPSLPSWPAAAPSVQRWESPGDVAVSTGLAQRSPDGAVHFAPQGPAGGAGSQPSMVSRALDPAATTTSAVPAGGQPAGTAAVTGVGDSPAAAAGPPDIAAMTDLLYERIEYRLRTDLLLERERMGSLPDF